MILEILITVFLSFFAMGALITTVEKIKQTLFFMTKENLFDSIGEILIDVSQLFFVYLLLGFFAYLIWR